MMAAKTFAKAKLHFRECYVKKYQSTVCFSSILPHQLSTNFKTLIYATN
jgi:hypothetical protein